MALPKAVQDQLDQAEALERELAGAGATQGEDPPVSTEQTADVVEPAPEPVVPENAAPVPEPEVRSEDFEQKYRTLKGMYDAEVPRLHQQNRELTAQLQHVVSQVADLTARLNATPEPAPAPAEPSEFVTEKDRADFGEDLIDLQRRVAKEVAKEFKNELAALREENKQLKGTVDVLTGNQVVSAEEKFFTGLAAAVPEWEQINSDPQFIGWLGERFPGTAMTRKDALINARQHLDLQSVKELFLGYKEATTPPPVAAPSRAEQLRQQVAPSRTRSTSAPSVDPSTRIYSLGEYAQLMDPRALRKMTTEEVTALMSELDAAQAEGRVR